jgi:bifunctional DNA-binding transcriptional regulator/antitoxin component of YhaV-PrlF toxin-antitoxin module
MERKIISVTAKRQITIPIRFYEKLGFGKEIECLLTDDAVLLRPLSRMEDGSSMEMMKILKDLVSQGLSGDELLAKFAEKQESVKKGADAAKETR